MGYDPFLPISLAQVNVLCVPAGAVTAAKFEEFLRAFRAFDIVPLRNINGSSGFCKFRDGQILLKVGTDLNYEDVNTPNNFDFNSRPQIVVGLVDGEALPIDHNSDSATWLESTSTALYQSTTDINKGAIHALVVLGGNQIPVSEGSYFVDLDGDGPSLINAIQGIVLKFQTHLESTADGLTVQSSGTKEHRNNSQSSSNTDPSRHSDTSNPTFDRTNNPALGSRASGQVGYEVGTTAGKAVLIGQLNLQAGQWPEALRHFSEGAIIARDESDHHWFAKALEGLLVCMILFAWAHLDFNIPQICYPTTDKKGPVHGSPSMGAICNANRSASDSLSTGRSISSANTLTLLLPQLLNVIIGLYERSAGIFQESSQFKRLCQARIRWGNLLLSVKKNGNGLNDAALQSLVEGGKPASLSKQSDASTASLILYTKALTKLFVDAALEAQSKISIKQAAPLQIAVAYSLSILGVERKQAFHLREFLQKLGPALVEARRSGAAEMGIHPSTSLPSLAHTEGAVSEAMVSGIEALLESICESYGLPRIATVHSEAQSSPTRNLREALLYWSAAHQAGDVAMRIDLLSLCIEVAESLPDFQCSLNFVSRLLQVAVGKPMLHANGSNAAPLLSETEQSRLVLNIRKTASSAARFGMPNVRAKYWDKCLVRHIEVSEDLTSNKLIGRTPRDLFLASSTKGEAKKDPFIFNPFAKAKAGAGQSAIVVGEQAKFNVVLQNPLQVDVEIEDIVLVVEGCDFQPDHHSIVLGPLCSQVFTLTGKALCAGDLVISGCRATIRGCSPEDFVIVHGDWRPMRTAKQMTQIATTESLDNVVLPEIRNLSLKVTTPLPKLSIMSTSLLQQSVMLLEGEKIIFTITLQNSTDIDVDFVLLSFEDSVTRRLEEALNNKDLLPADLYEIQNQIATRPVIRMVNGDYNGDERVIPGHKPSTFTLELFGRPGLTDVTILIDYTYLGMPKEEVKESFYTRQLRHTVTTTINGSVDIPRCSVLPLEGDLLANYRRRKTTNEQDTLLSVLGTSEGENKQCILLLDVRNIWPQPLIVEFQACQSSSDEGEELYQWEAGSTVSETLQPGQMTRLLLLAPRILITNPYTPIPSLDTKRQFVVSASKMTIEAEAASRESFWYRENLLKCLRASWQEQNGCRKGQIDMRKGIRLSSRMIDALRVDLVEISFSVKASENLAEKNTEELSSVRQLASSRYSLARNKFASLVTTVHNRSKEELKLLVRLQVSLRNQPHNIALDLSKRFAWSGVLQRALQPPLKPDETRQFELGVIALAEGEYEINGTAEEVKSRLPKTETSSLEVGSGAERRMWHARKPCMIDAVDIDTY